MVSTCSAQEHGVLLGMELEVSLLVDGVTLPGVLVLPTVVGVDVSVGPSTVQVYVHVYVNYTLHTLRTLQSFFTSIIC